MELILYSRMNDVLTQGWVRNLLSLVENFILFLTWDTDRLSTRGIRDALLVAGRTQEVQMHTNLVDTVSAICIPVELYWLLSPLVAPTLNLLHRGRGGTSSTGKNQYYQQQVQAFILCTSFYFFTHSYVKLAVTRFFLVTSYGLCNFPLTLNNMTLHYL